MDEAFRIVIPNEVRNLVFSERDCHVAPLLAMTALKELLNLDINFFSSTVIPACLESFFSPSLEKRGKGRLPNKKFSS